MCNRALAQVVTIEGFINKDEFYLMKMKQLMQDMGSKLIELGYVQCTNNPEYKQIIEGVADRHGQKIFVQTYSPEKEMYAELLSRIPKTLNDVSTPTKIHRFIFLLPSVKLERRIFGYHMGITIAELVTSGSCSTTRFGSFDKSGKPLNREAQELSEILFN